MLPHRHIMKWYITRMRIPGIRHLLGLDSRHLQKMAKWIVMLRGHSQSSYPCKWLYVPRGGDESSESTAAKAFLCRLKGHLLSQRRLACIVALLQAEDVLHSQSCLNRWPRKHVASESQRLHEVIAKKFGEGFDPSRRRPSPVHLQ